MAGDKILPWKQAEAAKEERLCYQESQQLSRHAPARSEGDGSEHLAASTSLRPRISCAGSAHCVAGASAQPSASYACAPNFGPLFHAELL